MCEYYDSYLISRKNKEILVYDTELDEVVSIGVDKSMSLKYHRNRILCAYEDGRLEYCQIK